MSSSSSESDANINSPSAASLPLSDTSFALPKHVSLGPHSLRPKLKGLKPTAAEIVEMRRQRKNERNRQYMRRKRINDPTLSARSSRSFRLKSSKDAERMVLYKEQRRAYRRKNFKELSKKRKIYLKKKANQKENILGKAITKRKGEGMVGGERKNKAHSIPLTIPSTGNSRIQIVEHNKEETSHQQRERQASSRMNEVTRVGNVNDPANSTGRRTIKLKISPEALKKYYNQKQNRSPSL